MSPLQVTIGIVAIVATGMVIAAILFWKENRNRRVGIASYAVGLVTTVVAGAVAGIGGVVVYLAVLLLYFVAGGIRETLELAILILGSWMAVQHFHSQAEKNGRERVSFAYRMQDEWTKSITKAIVADNPTAAEEAASETRELYRECRISMNTDAAMLLNRAMKMTAMLRAMGCDPDQKRQIKNSLVGLVVPPMPAGTSDPVTTVILELFRAYRQGGLSGWFVTRRLLRLAEGSAFEVRLVGSGLVEHEDAVLDDTK